MSKQKKVLLIVSGASASGKDTIMNEFHNHNEINKLVGFTNRKQRANEIDGEDYFFSENHPELQIEVNDWERVLGSRDELLISRTGVGNGGRDRYAFTLKQLKDGLNYVILDVEGQEKMSQLINHNKDLENLKVFKIFVATENPDIAIQRMKERGSENSQDFAERIAHAKKQNSKEYMIQYDTVIINKDYKESVKELERFLAFNLKKNKISL